MDLHFEASGAGETTVLCVHGWGCEGAQFRPLITAMGAGYRFFCPDLPGHGKTPLGNFQPSFWGFAQCVEEFALEQKMGNPILIGHSMGGALSLMAASRGRIRPRAVINLDGSLPAAQSTLSGQAVLRSWLGDGDFRRKLEKALWKSFFLPHEHDARCKSIVKGMCSAPEAVLRFLPEQIETLHAEEILPGVKAPVLYIGAAIPRFDAQQAADLVADFRFEQIANTGHFLHVYAPDRVAALAKKFLASLT